MDESTSTAAAFWFCTSPVTVSLKLARAVSCWSSVSLFVAYFRLIFSSLSCTSSLTVDDCAVSRHISALSFLFVSHNLLHSC